MHGASGARSRTAGMTISKGMHLAHHYDALFFDYIERGSRSSARGVLPLLRDTLPIRSVLDAGCGRGVWLSEWITLGVKDVLGVDGHDVNAGPLAIPRENFRPQDVSDAFDLGRGF